jgi:putative ABC transport system permease protein
MLPFRPILATLRHHRLTSLLLMLQVAFTCAIVCNAVFLVVQRVQRVRIDSGLSEQGLAQIKVADLQSGDNPLSLHRADLAALRTLPDVQSATLIDHLPLSGSASSQSVCGSLEAAHALIAARSPGVPGCAEPEMYQFGQQGVRTLGLTLVSGRDFRDDEYSSGQRGSAVNSAAGVIITQALARKLYPSGHAVGEVLYFGKSGLLDGHGTPVVGVMRHLARGRLVKRADNDLAMVMPVAPNDSDALFLLRMWPGRTEQGLAAAVHLLKQRRPQRDIAASDAKTYSAIRAAYFQRDTTMIGLLVASATGLLFVTALGIAGLASFWVGQRRRSIGVQRALGATRHDILHYFQAENFLIVSSGIVLGTLMAAGLNLWLMRHYEVAQLPWGYLPIGAVLLWLLGQVAVLAPALRAARVPPVVATRGA